MFKDLNCYEHALDILLKKIDQASSLYDEVTALKIRLQENASQQAIYGKTETLSNERVRILTSLDKFSRQITGKNLDELDREKDLEESSNTASKPSKIFPGLMSFGINEKDIFFGRQDEITQLVNHITEDPVLVINGLLGCGKSSLVKAGIIPNLPTTHYVIYLSVFENITKEISQKVSQLLDSETNSEDWVLLVQKLNKQKSKHIVLIVDQFERALSQAHDPSSLEKFIKGIPRLINEINGDITIVLVLRADWLYYLETTVHHLYPELHVHSYIFTLAPLTKEAAEKAIIEPLKINNLHYDNKTIKEIINALQCSSIGPSTDYYIQPIQLQIVLRSLLKIAQRLDRPESALTKEIYDISGGVGAILRNYLEESVGTKTESWRILSRFIAQDGKTGRAIRHSELVGVPAGQDINSELKFLLEQGLVEVQESSDNSDRFYRLSHDYLVETIVKYLNQNPDQQAWKLAEDWLAIGILEWQESTKTAPKEELLLEKSRYFTIYEYRDGLTISENAQVLLVLTSLRYGHGGLSYWLSRSASNTDKKIQIISDKLLSPKTEVQETARKALSDSIRPSQNSVSPLPTDLKTLLANMLWQKMNKPPKANKEAAAQALWVIQEFDSRKKWLVTLETVILHWIKAHAKQIASYILTTLIALLLTFAGLQINEKMRGHWEYYYTLKGGNTPLIITDPVEGEIVYAMTANGILPHQGNALFARKGDNWQLLGENLSKAWPTSIISTDKHIYISLYGDGIIKSENSGQSWQLINKGLPSRGITSLAINTDTPSTIYAATDDWRGVLISTDSGNSWNFYDTEGEIYGAIITRIAYTRANEGTLIAGTADGRILRHHQNAKQWDLSYGLSKGSISALMVHTQDDNYIYAGTTRGIILRSQNGAENWEVLGTIGNRSQNEFKVTALAIDPNELNQLYAAAYGNGGYKIWRSQDKGQTWELLPNEGLPRSEILALTAFTENRSNKSSLAAGTIDGLFISQDNGTTWQREDLGAPIANIKQLALSRKTQYPIYAAVGGTIYSNLTGDLQTWISGQGLHAEEVRTIIVDPDDPYTAYAGVLIVGEWSVFKTKDGGKTWYRTTPPPIMDVVPDTTALALAVTESGQRILYAGTTGCGILQSLDGGTTWNTFGKDYCSQLPSDAPVDTGFLSVDTENPYLIYASNNQWFYSSNDGGETWQSTPIEINSQIVGMVADPEIASTVYIITRSDGFWRSDDNGQTWEKLGDDWFRNIELTDISAKAGTAGELSVAASSGGVWQTVNGGDTWRPIRENLEISDITSIANMNGSHGQIIVSTRSSGIAIYHQPENLINP